MKKVTTLCLVTANSQILLGYKKRGFGLNRWNGFGGKVENNESITDAARRELLEECGIQAHNLEQRGVLNFRFEDYPEELEVHLFQITEYSGEPTETEEMRPQWFYSNELPFDKMWPDDRFWFPYFLEGKDFEAVFLFKDYDHLLEYNIKEIPKA